MPEKIQFFKNKEKGLVNPRLFTDIAESWVNAIASNELFTQENKKQVKEKEKITVTQIRKFFNEMLKRKTAIETGASTFENEYPYILMLKAKVAYAYARGNINQTFKKFIEESLNLISNESDFKVFVDFFESIIAYAKAHPDLKE